MTLALALFLSAAMSYVSNACTSIIVSGKATEDGRPIMWKNRDAGGQNMMFFFNKKELKDAKYSFIGVINSGVSKAPNALWGGTNEKGLCVMNTMSYNVNIKAVKGETSSGNGKIQRDVLAVCATVDEVEEFLKKLPQPTGLTTNLGVFDAQGNCAYFECHSFGYKKYDVNDPAVAPDGYIVRSNYSISNRPVTEGHGQIRYMEAERQIRHALADRTVNIDYFFTNIARSFCNPYLGVDLKSGNFNKPKTNGWYVDEDFITRYSSLSSMIFQGVLPTEKPELTTMWTIIGYPAATVCMPVWVKGGAEGIPAQLAPNADKKSTMANNASILRNKVYSFTVDTTDKRPTKYFNWEELFNLQGTGIMQKCLAKEAEILPPYKAALEGWRKANKVNAKQIVELNKVADEALAAFYKEEFDL